MTTAEAVRYLRWKKDVAEHDYTAASSYPLSDPGVLAYALDPYADVPLKLG